MAGTAVFLVLMVDSVVNGLFVPLSMLYLSASSGASLVRVGTLLSVAATVPGMLALAPRLPKSALATGEAGPQREGDAREVH
ncbi:hypothetical protein ACFV23_15470 [Streptomyces sp. NPDC059627]